MELLELYQKLLNIFDAKEASDLGHALMDAVTSGDIEKYSAYLGLGMGLKQDDLQRIFQYYCADREEKKQDFTPASLAKLLAVLTSNTDELVDMCAGSGALTIQAWAENDKRRFVLYELDEKVIPYLLFNLAVATMCIRIRSTTNTFWCSRTDC